eukprot:gene22274-28850_t
MRKPPKTTLYENFTVRPTPIVKWQLYFENQEKRRLLTSNEQYSSIYRILPPPTRKEWNLIDLDVVLSNRSTMSGEEVYLRGLYELVIETSQVVALLKESMLRDLDGIH